MILFSWMSMKIEIQFRRENYSNLLDVVIVTNEFLSICFIGLHQLPPHRKKASSSHLVMGFYAHMLWILFHKTKRKLCIQTLCDQIIMFPIRNGLLVFHIRDIYVKQ